MALCRLSDYQCDLYIYESRYGKEVHVAARRYVNETKSPPLQLLQEDFAAFRKVYMEYLKSCESVEEVVPIDLTHAGASHTFVEWSEVLEFVTELKELGYQVPDWVLDAIREEMTEEAAESSRRDGR